jgi:CHAD domain-containing protein
LATESFPNHLLDRPAHEAARWLALAHLDELRHARHRLNDLDDDDALHDFRVALRRLRSVCRAYRDVLDESVSGKTRRRLRELARATGARRDADVRLQWLDEHRSTLGAGGSDVVDWIGERLQRARREADRNLAHLLDRHFADVTEKLQRRFSRYHLVHTLGEEPRVLLGRDMVAHSLGTLARALDLRIGTSPTAADVRDLHRTRIAAKRLRYALEPLVDENVATIALARSAAKIIARLTAIQDALGELHDAQSFGQLLADLAAEAAATNARRDVAMDADPNANEEPVGPASLATATTLIEIQQCLRHDIESCYRDVFSSSGQRRIVQTLASVDRLAVRLARRPRSRTAPPAIQPPARHSAPDC